MSRLVFDLAQEGLLCVLRPYQIAVMHHFWNMEKPMGSRVIHEFLQEIGGDAAKSRATVINFLNAMVNEGFLDCDEETCKGGSRRIYRLNDMSKTEQIFRNHIRLKFYEKLSIFNEGEGERDMSKVGIICPVCLKTHVKIGMQWIDAKGTRHVMASGDPYCSDECREIARSSGLTPKDAEA